MAAGKSINEQELAVLAFWNTQHIFEETLSKTKDCKPYVFYDGPPFATGLPHYGHLLGSIIKDVYGRFWTMQGRHVARVWGWDCHGLPIENLAEQDLGLTSKADIEAMGVGTFNEHCRSKVLGYVDEWKKVINRIGRWVDMDDAYHTMDNSYIESVWWAFKQLWEKGYIYKGEKILMYCPRCSTPLAKAEIAMDNSYKTIKDESVVVTFKLTDEDVYALAWTTTPWTLPSNLALTVNPNLTYVYLNDVRDGKVYLLAKDLVSKFYQFESDYQIIKEVSGKDLEGTQYEPLFPYFSETESAFRFLLGDFVTAEDGTGIVHTAPAFGEDDYEVCKNYGIPVVQPVDENGLFTDAVFDFKGMFVHDSNKAVIDFLKAQGKVVRVKKISHEYPFCYRCDTKLLYRAIPAWFVNIQKIKPRLLELNQKLNWYPSFLQEGRVKYTLETAPDWNISRNRYWATAIPIWESDDGDRLVIGSIDELQQYAQKLPDGPIDLHKHYLDSVVLVKDGKSYHRVPEVLDCWFESGSMTFAQFHYPFENKDYFERNFPAQFVAEYIAQVRTWFYYMNVLAAILFDDVPFENVVTTGNILADDGQKMSKSKKNFTDPMILVDRFGVDALRFYLASAPVMNAQDINFSDKQVEEVYKKVLVLLYNVNNFYALYNTVPDAALQPSDVMDRWILSRFTRVADDVTNYLKNYNTVKACAVLREFVDDLSTWYVRQTRERFSSGDVQAKATLRFVLENLAIIAAPIIPFVSETIYQTIHHDKTSVHLQDWVTAATQHSDSTLDGQMAQVRSLVSIGLKERDLHGMGLKWPLSEAVIMSPEPLPDELLNVLIRELNVKRVVVKKADALSVTLDVTLTPELEAEGFSRELMRKVQAARKHAGLVKTDAIELVITSDFDSSLRAHEDSIRAVTGSKTITFGNLPEQPLHSESGTIRGKSYNFAFKKV